MDDLEHAISSLKKDEFIRKTWLDFANCTVQRHKFALGIDNYYRSLEFDLVPVLEKEINDTFIQNFNLPEDE